MRAACAFVACLLTAGCAADTVDAPEDVVVASAFYSLTSGSVRWINGSYTSCTNRSGNWSTRVSGNGTMDNAALTVVKNDSACVLTITSVVADQTYAASPAIALGTSYLASPSAFGIGAGQFLANARLEAGGFANDFQITFVLADTSDPPVSTATVAAAYANVTATAVATTVTAPSYTIDISNLSFQADPIRLIYGVTGTAVLRDGAVTGASYAIDSSLGATPTFAQVASAYDSAFLTQKTISGANPVVQASEFGVVSLSLFPSTQIRSLIVKRTVGGVAAYQVFRITFVS